MNYRKELLSLFIFLLLAGIVSHAQNEIKGTVVDSLLLAPLTKVHVKIKNFDRGTSTDEQGQFTIDAMLYDTLQFSCVGYLSMEIPITRPGQDLFVSMSMFSMFLKPVVTYANIILPGVKRLPKESNWVNTTYRPVYWIVQTFGLGYVIKGPISHFSKSEKEKRKLITIQEENSKTKTYLEVVNSPEVKGALMERYSFNEEKYYEILARFNQANLKSMYDLERKSLIFSIFHFFETDIKNKSTVDGQ